MPENKQVNDEFVTSDTVDKVNVEEAIAEEQVQTENVEAIEHTPEMSSSETETQAPASSTQAISNTNNEGEQSLPHQPHATQFENMGVPPTYVITPNAEKETQEKREELSRTETTAMILGIISVVLSGCCCVNMILAIIAICLAAKTKKLSENKKISSTALLGLICACVSLGITVLIMVLYVAMFLFSFLMAEIMETSAYLLPLL